MEQGLKQRLTGATVIVILAVIFIPMLLDTSVEEKQLIRGANIPTQPADMPAPPDDDFSSRIIPMEQMPEQITTEETATVETRAPEVPAGPAPAVDEKIPPPDASAPKPAQPRAPVIESDGKSSGVGVSAWVVQLGSFSSEEKAEALNQKLRKAGFKAFVEPLKQKDGTFYRVRIGPELKKSDAEALRARLKKDMQKEGIIVSYP